MLTYENLQKQSRIELEHRLRVLSADVSAWTADARLTGLGLSPAQRLAVKDLTGVLQQRQTDAFSLLTTNLGQTDFGDQEAKLLLEMTGAQELWQVFRTILAQNEDPATTTAVKTAARIAGDCYQWCIRRARAFQALRPDRFREQPLVFLEAVDSPATAGRQDQARLLSTSIRQWRDVMLPLPIALLPFDYGDSIWTMCALQHEVGHNFDQDMEITLELRGALLDIVPADNEPHWRRWAREIVADTIALMLGGVGFALSIARLAFTLGPASRFQEQDDEAVHPPLPLRIRLLTEMLQATNVSDLATQAAALETVWDASTRPSWLAAFVSDTSKVAQHFLLTKLTSLNQHSLLELNPSLADDHRLIVRLANFFVTGKDRPVPSVNEGMHPRLVCSAAQLAFRQAPTPTSELPQTLQSTALKYLDLIAPVSNLAASTSQATERRANMQALVKNIDFERVGTSRREAAP